MNNREVARESIAPEEILLESIGHEIMNFRRGFPKNSLKHTFILSPYGSSMFGLMPQGKQIYLGIPERFYELFKTSRLLYAAKVKGQAGLFLVMQMGSGAARHEVGIRIFVRSKRLEALAGNVTTLRAVPMMKGGITRETDLLQGFNLKILETDTFQWEIEG